MDCMEENREKTNIFIIGTPRSGKSTLATMLSQLFSYQIIRTDCLRDAFSKTFPSLNINSHTAKHSDEFKTFLKKYLDYCCNQSRYEFGYIVEGTDILPKDYIDVFKEKNTIIFALGQLEEKPEKIMENMKTYDTPLDWSYHMEDELSYCVKQKQEAASLKEECQKYEIPFYDTSIVRQEVFNKIVEEIRKYL